MIERLKRQIVGGTNLVAISKPADPQNMMNKINELVDAVNDIQKEREAERFEIQEWIGILEAVRKSVNIHEKQIDELQMKAEPEKATISKMEKVEPADPYAENTQDENPRCPFCGEELSYAQEIDGGFEILTCDCPHGIWFFGNDKMWYNLEKVITELDRTRKALDKAKDWLEQVATLEKCDDDLCREFTKRKLAEIKTALEQKE